MVKQKQEIKPSVNFEYKLYNLFNTIKHLNSVNIKATSEGIEFWGMDLSNAMMSEVFIDKENIRNYEQQKEIQITTDTDYLRIVKRLYLEFKDKQAIFRATGKYGTITKTLQPDEQGLKIFEKSKDSIKVGLSVDLFKNALNGADGKMNITLSENSPVIVEYLPTEYSKLTEKVKHIIAPRVESDDFEEEYPNPNEEIRTDEKLTSDEDNDFDEDDEVEEEN